MPNSQYRIDFFYLRVHESLPERRLADLTGKEFAVMTQHMAVQLGEVAEALITFVTVITLVFMVPKTIL
jgi:hypothetical protein